MNESLIQTYVELVNQDTLARFINNSYDKNVCFLTLQIQEPDNVIESENMLNAMFFASTDFSKRTVVLGILMDQLEEIAQRLGHTVRKDTQPVS